MHTIKLNRQTTPPVAKKHPKTLISHQDKRVDNYYWMRDDNHKDEHVLAHLNAENDYCDSVLNPTLEMQNKLFDELKKRIEKDDSSVPVKDGVFWYHSKVTGDDEYARYYRATSFEGDNQTLLLDINQLAAMHDFFDLGEIAISPNDELLAYSEDTDSRRIYTIKFKDIASNKYLADELKHTEGQLVWANDNKTVFYVKKDLQTLLGYQVYRHVLGTWQDEE